MTVVRAHERILTFSRVFTDNPGSASTVHGDVLLIPPHLEPSMSKHKPVDYRNLWSIRSRSITRVRGYRVRDDPRPGARQKGFRLVAASTEAGPVSRLVGYGLGQRRPDA